LQHKHLVVLFIFPRMYSSVILASLYVYHEYLPVFNSGVAMLIVPVLLVSAY